MAVLATVAIEWVSGAKAIDAQVAPALIAVPLNASPPVQSIARAAHDNVVNEIKYKAAMMGWDLREMTTDEWKPCNNAQPVTDSSCVMRLLLVNGEVVGVVSDSPTEPPQYQHVVLWRN